MEMFTNVDIATAFAVLASALAATKSAIEIVKLLRKKR